MLNCRSCRKRDFWARRRAEGTAAEMAYKWEIKICKKNKRENTREIKNQKKKNYGQLRHIRNKEKKKKDRQKRQPGESSGKRSRAKEKMDKVGNSEGQVLVGETTKRGVGAFLQDDNKSKRQRGKDIKQGCSKNPCCGKSTLTEGKQ